MKKKKRKKKKKNGSPDMLLILFQCNPHFNTFTLQYLLLSFFLQNTVKYALPVIYKIMKHNEVC